MTQLKSGEYQNTPKTRRGKNKVGDQEENNTLTPVAVSYTHLDVYKRQIYLRSNLSTYDLLFKHTHDLNNVVHYKSKMASKFECTETVYYVVTA